jgi:hypothetical protein
MVEMERELGVWNGCSGAVYWLRLGKERAKSTWDYVQGSRKARCATVFHGEEGLMLQRMINLKGCMKAVLRD